MGDCCTLEIRHLLGVGCVGIVKREAPRKSSLLQPRNLRLLALEDSRDIALLVLRPAILVTVPL